MNLKIIFLLLFPLVAFSQNRIKDTLYGNVRSVREKLIFLDSVRQNYKLFAIEDEYGHFGFTSRKFTQGRFNTFWYSLPFVHYLNYYREYNDKNQIIAETWYFKDNSFLTRYEFLYDKIGNLIEEKKIDELGETTVKRWGYDCKNRLATFIRLFGGPESFSFSGYQYDVAGNLSEECYYLENEKKSDTKYEYQNGKIIRCYKTYPYVLAEGSDSQRHKKQWGEWDTYLYEEYEYDMQGNKTTVKNYMSKIEGYNVPPQIIRYTYDTNNNMTSIINCYPESHSSWYFTYDNKNRITSEKHIVNSKTLIYSKLYYEGDNPAKLIYTENDKTTTVTFNYKFDSHNNWIEQTKSIDGKPLYVRRREIVY